MPPEELTATAAPWTLLTNIVRCAAGVDERTGECFPAGLSGSAYKTADFPSNLTTQHLARAPRPLLLFLQSADFAR
jgi:hypothetical protein